MSDNLKIKMYSFTLDSKSPYESAEFYAKLLHWEIPFHDEEYACIAPPETERGAYPGITFQFNPDYIPPVWPDKPEAQQQMAHLDFVVNDVEEAVRHAIKCGATVAGEQFSDAWTVMLDPDGHPFCLCRGEELFQRPHFALL